MQDTHEVISAFIDGEPFDPQQLLAALADPGGRELLIDLLALRRVTQVDVPVPAVVSRGRGTLRLVIAAAAIVVALAGGYRWGSRAVGTTAAPPVPTRVITNVGEWQGGTR